MVISLPICLHFDMNVDRAESLSLQSCSFGIATVTLNMTFVMTSYHIRCYSVINKYVCLNLQHTFERWRDSGGHINAIFIEINKNKKPAIKILP